MAVRVLLVDGSLEGATLVGKLEQLDYDVVAVGTPREAHEWLDRNICDLLVLDLAPCDYKGLQLCNQIRERCGPHMVIILTSDSSSTSHRIIGLELGADDFVIKPFEIEEFLARLEARLRRHQPTQSRG